MTIGERIRVARRYFKLSIKEFALRTDVHWRKLSDMELGHKEVEISYLYKIQGVFNVNIEWLESGSGDMLLPEASNGMTPEIRQTIELMKTVDKDTQKSILLGAEKEVFISELMKERLKNS